MCDNKNCTQTDTNKKTTLVQQRMEPNTHIIDLPMTMDWLQLETKWNLQKKKKKMCQQNVHSVVFSHYRRISHPISFVVHRINDNNVCLYTMYDGIWNKKWKEWTKKKKTGVYMFAAKNQKNGIRIACVRSRRSLTLNAADWLVCWAVAVECRNEWMVRPTKNALVIIMIKAKRHIHRNLGPHNNS